MNRFIKTCRRSLVLLYGAVVALGLQSCEAINDNSLLSAIPAPEYAMYLGAGVETLEDNRPMSLALENDSKNAVRFPGMSQQMSTFEIVENQEQLRELYRRTISNSTKVNIKGVDVEASVSSFAEKNSSFESNSLSLAIIIIYLRDKVIMDSARFHGEASQLLETGQITMFRQRYGNGFVREVDLGGYLLIQYNISTESLNTKDIDRLKAALSVKYAMLVQNTTSVEIEQETERLLRSVSRTGRVVSSARSLNSSNLVDTAEKYQETVREFAAYFDRPDAEWSSLVRYISPYNLVYDPRFGNAPFPQLEIPVAPPPPPRNIENFWTPHVSEEQGEQFPALCDGGLVRGFHCKGRYCDDIALHCRRPYRTTATNWTDYFSEEGNNFRMCSEGQFVSGLRCSGSFCDNVSLRCSQVPELRIDRGSCHWSDSFSEENGGMMASPDNYYIAGMECQGRNCDNKRAFLCRADFVQ